MACHPELARGLKIGHLVLRSGMRPWQRGSKREYQRPACASSCPSAQNLERASQTWLNDVGSAAENNRPRKKPFGGGTPAEAMVDEIAGLQIQPCT